MFELDHVDPAGFTERLSAGYVYAEAMAHWAGYTGPTTRELTWYWYGEDVPRRLYHPSVHGTPVVAKLFQPRRMVGLSLMDPVASGITCRMLGEPWDDDALFGLIAALRALPYAGLVAHAMIHQADWLDEHPERRGLPPRATLAKPVFAAAQKER